MALKDWKKITGSEFYNKKKNISIKLSRSIREVGTGNWLYDVQIWDWEKSGLDRIKTINYGLTRNKALYELNKYIRKN